MKHENNVQLGFKPTLSRKPSIYQIKYFAIRLGIGLNLQSHLFINLNTVQFLLGFNVHFQKIIYLNTIQLG